MAGVAILGGALALAAPAGFDLWKASQLQATEKRLAGKVKPQQPATEQMANWGNHSMMMAQRVANGEAELHETQNDIFIVEQGTATLVLGGTVVNGKTTAPNEIRGTSIKGGERRVIGPGDVVHINARVPHQLLVESGKPFTYLIVKVNR